MKKSVFLIILIIYVASILFIGLFGMEIALFDQKLYVSDIVVTNESNDLYSVYESESDQITYITFFYNKDYDGDWQSGHNPNTVILSYRVVPEDATNRRVSFSCDTNYEGGTNPYGEVTENGVVRFKRAGSITVTITSLDGSNTKTRVTVVARKTI